MAEPQPFLTRRRTGALELPRGGMLWRVWAPHARRVDLILHYGERREAHAMSAEQFGYFHYRAEQFEEGQRYSLRLDGGPERPDPCSLWQPEGVHAPSAVFRPSEFRWTDQHWHGVSRHELVFYELHVGTFTPEGTFEAIIPRLPELRELGITAIELMPVAQFPGERDWGYNGVALYAAQQSYGGPRKLQELINACHEHELAVFLDVVYNHLGPEGNYLGEFGPYFTDRYRNNWNQALNFDDSGCDAVRDFVVDNARMWLEEFHFDGLRLDAVHSMIDMSAQHILEMIQSTVKESARRMKRQLHTTAESDMNVPRFLETPRRGGYGLDMQWSDDFHHALHAYLTGERDGYYADYGEASQLAQVLENPFLYAGSYSHFRDRKHGAPANHFAGDRFVVAVQNHDQIGNRAKGERMAQLVCTARLRLVASLLCLTPHIPLIFMGQEYGEQNPFLYFCSFGDPALRDAVREGRRREFADFEWQGEVPDPNAVETFERSRLTWLWPQGSHHAGLRALYRDLLAARRQWPALHNFEERQAFYLPGQHGDVLRLLRGGREYEYGRTVEALFNFTAETQVLKDLPPAPQVRLFSSELAKYGGGLVQQEPERQLLPYECVVYGPPTWESLI